MKNGLACLALALLILAPRANCRAEGLKWRELLKQSDAWYRSAEGKAAVSRLRSNQASVGGWPKNFDTSAQAFEGDRSRIKATFDNGATVGELRVLARAVVATDDHESAQAFLKGLDHILKAQYANGGWPQSSPPGKGYARHITFNDNTMVNLLEFVREVAGKPEYRFVDETRRTSCARAFEKGIACLLKCQVRVRGVLTVWCAQHDEVTFEPRPARSFELVSLSGAESAGILKLLMSLDAPSDGVKAAVRAGAAWFEKSRLEGIRQIVKDKNKVIVVDASAPALWARFYEIDTNRPLFSGRDGVKKYTIAEIEAERRNGYAWYGTWGKSVAREFKLWSMRVAGSAR